MPPRTMRALVLDDYQTSRFRSAQIDTPVPRKGEVLIRIKAVGVNPIDYKIRKGVAPYAMPNLPAVLGTDLSGVVEALGDGVGDFRVGDEVYGLVGGVRGLQGSLAEFVAVDADLLARKPKSLSMAEAAAIPLVVLTAWEGLVDRARVRLGQSVLVTGGAGGVGQMAVQIARARGAEVFATGRARNLEIIRQLGATAIEAENTPVADYVAKYTAGRGFDIVYDTVGGSVLDVAFDAVASYGHVVSCAAFGVHNLAPASLKAATISGVFVLLPMLCGRGRRHHGDILRLVAEIADSGKLKPVLDPRRFNLDTAIDAHNAVETGGAAGKIVIGVST
jgi:NADPH:quinone reductase